MKPVLLFSVVGFVAVAVVVGVLWPWLDGGGRRGLLLAGGSAWAVQSVAFALIARRPPERFLGAWVAGTALRAVTVVAVTVYALGAEEVSLLAALLGLAAFLFVLLILEPVVLKGTGRLAGRGGGEARTSPGGSHGSSTGPAERAEARRVHGPPERKLGTTDDTAR